MGFWIHVHNPYKPDPQITTLPYMVLHPPAPPENRRTWMPISLHVKDKCSWSSKISKKGENTHRLNQILPSTRHLQSNKIQTSHLNPPPLLSSPKQPPSTEVLGFPSPLENHQFVWNKFDLEFITNSQAEENQRGASKNRKRKSIPLKKPMWFTISLGRN